MLPGVPGLVGEKNRGGGKNDMKLGRYGIV